MAAAAAIASARAYKKMKKERLQNQGGTNQAAWIAAFQRKSQELGFAETDEENDKPTVTAPQEDAVPSPRLLTRGSSFYTVVYNHSGWYTSLARHVNSRIVRRPWFDRFITGCILLVAIATGIDVSFVHADTVPTWARLVTGITSTVTLVVFTSECVLKIVAFGRRPQHYFTDQHEGNYNTCVPPPPSTPRLTHL